MDVAKAGANIDRNAKKDNKPAAQQGSGKGRKRDRFKPAMTEAEMEEMQKEIQKQVKETYAKMNEGKKNNFGAKYRKEKRELAAQRSQEEREQASAEGKVLKVTEFVTVNDLATLMIGYNDRCWYNASTEAYKAGLDDLCARINYHTQGAPLVLFTPAPGTGECYGLLGPYAVATREVAAKRGLPLFDLNAILSQKGYDSLCGLYFDRAHPNAEGHRIIAEELFRFLLSFMDK